MLISPKLLNSFEAIFLRILLIIFPDLVFGSPLVIWILSNLAIGPIFLEIKILISFLISSRFSCSCFRVIKPYKAFPLISCGKPTIADSATNSCSLIASSIGAVPRLWPETMITSSTLPVILKLPSSSLNAPSPVKYLFSKAEN